MRTILAVLGALALGALAVGMPGDASADVDLTGNWNVELVGPVTFNYQAQVTQSGTDLEIDFSLGDAQLDGTIDPVTGEFDVFGCVGDCGGLSMTGTASLDGQTMSGTFSSGAMGSGTFTGVKKASCPWDVTGDGVVSVGDITAVVMAFGVMPAPPAADVNGDGSVSVGDIAAVVMHFGLTCP